MRRELIPTAPVIVSHQTYDGVRKNVPNHYSQMINSSLGKINFRI